MIQRFTTATKELGFNPKVPVTLEDFIKKENRKKWIREKGMMVFSLLDPKNPFFKESRSKKQYYFSSTFDRNPTKVEREMLTRHGFELKDRLISKNMTKDEMVYLTGGWFEEYVFNEVFDLLQKDILDDVMMGLTIENLGGVSNELDIAFVRDNVFYHIECKTLGEGDKDIVREEVYKKGAISTLLGKGEKRAFICTTLSKIGESTVARGQDYGIDILSLEHVRDIKNRIKERFGEKE